MNPLRLVCLSADATLRNVLREELEPVLLSGAVTLEVADPRSEEVSALLAHADGVLCGSLPRDLRQAAPSLRWIQFWSAGVDAQLYPELWDGNAAVCNASGIHAAACSEHILALMLAFARNLPGAFRAQQEHDWSARQTLNNSVFELEGKTVGIVGAGEIGQAIGKRCQAFGMRTIGTRRNPDQPTPGIDVVLSHIQYHDLVLASNFIVLALPLTPHTRHTFGEDEIEVLKKGTYLFNIGRGGLVDERYLVPALQKGWLAGAGLDVFEDEPLPPESPFWNLPNVIVTPHIGGATPLYWPRFARLVLRQIQHLLSGEPLENSVDKHLGY